VAKAITLVGAVQRWRSNSATQVGASVGKQGILQANGSPRQQLYNLMYYNPNLPTTPYSNGGLSGENTIQRYVLHSIDQEYLMANATTTPVEVDIYDIEAKRDTYNVMDYTDNQGESYTWYGAPQYCWTIGAQASMNLKPNNVYDPALVWGASPTESPSFNKYFKISKKTTVQLAQGGVHRHRYRRTYNKIMDASVYGNTEMYALEGITHHTMVVLKGTPVNISSISGGVDTVNTPTTANSLLEVVVSTEYQYTYSSVIAPGLVQQESLVTQNVSSTNQVNPGSGAVEFTDTAQI